MEGLYGQIFKIVSVYILVIASEYPLLYEYIKYICVCIHTCVYTPATPTATAKTDHIYICLYHWVRFSFEKRRLCDDCKVPYNLLICFLSCGDSFVLCRMNNIRCIRGCSRGDLRFLLALAAPCLPCPGRFWQEVLFMKIKLCMLFPVLWLPGENSSPRL